MENERNDMTQMATAGGAFPTNWRIASDYDPNSHMINLKGRDYLNVQNRLLWFIRDQRELTIRGLARMPYIVRTELVEMDREQGWAHFRTYVRDVLGNEATMYGSEAAKDFGDYAEKASTKSLGRALLALGYGTGFAPEMDEGERVADAPVERRHQTGNTDAQHQRAATTPPTPSAAEPTPLRPHAAAPATPTPSAAPAKADVAQESGPPATEQQMASIRKLCAAVGKPEPTGTLTNAQARVVITGLSAEYAKVRRSS